MGLCKVYVLSGMIATASSLAIDSTMPAVVALGIAPEGDFSQVDYQTDHPSPEATADHAIIQVTASSVNPVDWKILSGNAIRYPKIIGFDVAGTLMNDECSPRLNEGDLVWADVGNSDWAKGEYAQLGAYAGYVIAHCDQVGLAPPSINLTEAAVLPLVGLTSYEALSMTGAPWSGKAANLTVVVTSGAGGTGHVGLQMSKFWAGAGMVITAAGPDQLDFVKSMGADVAIDYTQEDVFDTLPDDSVDIVYDNYGAAGTADKAMRVLRSGGVYIYLPGKGGSLSNQTKAGVTQIDYGLTDSSDHATMDMLYNMVEAGQLRGYVQQSYNLENIVDAFDMSFSGSVTGKLGIQVLPL